MLRAAPAVAFIGIALLAVPAARGGLQTPALPTVIAADVPLYPRDLVRNGAVGTLTVHARVTTDGQRVASVTPLGASSPLTGLMVANLKTWRFAPHAAASFDVAFHYSIVPRSCDSLGQDTRPVATLKFPTDVEVVAEIDPVCDGMFPPPPTFGVYITRAAVPFYPAVARDRGIEGSVRVGVSAKGVLTVADGPAELGDPMVLAIRGWELSPPPFAEELQFTFHLVDAGCHSGGPTVVVGPHLTSFDVTGRRGTGCYSTSAVTVLRMVTSRRRSMRPSGPSAHQ